MINIMDISKSIRRSNDLIEALDLQHIYRYVNGMNSDNEFSENENYRKKNYYKFAVNSFTG